MSSLSPIARCWHWPSWSVNIQRSILMDDIGHDVFRVSQWDVVLRVSSWATGNNIQKIDGTLFLAHTFLSVPRCSMYFELQVTSTSGTPTFWRSGIKFLVQVLAPKELKPQTRVGPPTKEPRREAEDFSCGIELPFHPGFCSLDPAKVLFSSPK